MKASSDGSTPEMPYPLGRLVLAFSSSIVLYALIIFFGDAILEIQSQLAFRKGVPYSPLFLLLQLGFVVLVAPASFYFLAFLPVVLKEDSEAVRRRWWFSAIRRSLLLAFFAPLGVLYLFLCLFPSLF
jgi:hypothetical protein